MIRRDPATIMNCSLLLIFLSAATEAFLSNVPGHRRIQRAAPWAMSSDDLGGSSDDFDELADLWSMEDDDDDEELSTYSNSPPQQPVAAEQAPVPPAVSKKVGDFDDMANLWSREEEDDEDEEDGGWPGAMNEIHRLKEMARKSSKNLPSSLLLHRQWQPWS
jgi:hypothetical protein